jgi:II/X family phage/plasmid replication protein
MLQVSGNPAKFLQGHNVFGSDDLVGLARCMLERVADFLSLEPSPCNRSAWAHGSYELTRVDVTESYALADRHQVRTAIKALDQHSHLAHRGRGQLTKEGTVYWGKNSRRWALKAYCKGDELEAAGHKLPVGLSDLPALSRYANNLLRVELTLRGMELKSMEGDLHRAANWCETTASELHRAYVARLHIAESAMLAPHTIENLAPRLRSAYQLWKDGHDLRALYSRRSWYRYRVELLVHGIDIALQQPRERDDSKVVPLRLVLHARPVGVPAWAVGTPLYFEPHQQAA